MKYLFKGKFAETPDMEKAKKMRDRALIAQKEGVNNKQECGGRKRDDWAWRMEQRAGSIVEKG